MGKRLVRTDEFLQQRTNRPPRRSQTWLPGRSPDSRAHSSCWRIAFPRLDRRSGLRIRRHSFTVAGAAPDLVLVRLKHAPASRFTCRHVRSIPETEAKHLTTSRTMLTAALAIGKRQTHDHGLERLVDCAASTPAERSHFHESLVDSRFRFRRRQELDYHGAWRVAARPRSSCGSLQGPEHVQ